MRAAWWQPLGYLTSRARRTRQSVRELTTLTTRRYEEPETTMSHIPPPSVPGPRWSVDTVAEYVGVTALASAALLVAGLGFTSAYLSAWQIPLSAIQLDPLTIAMRSDAAIYDAVLITGVALVTGLALRRVERLAWGRTATTAAVVLAVLGLAALGGSLLYWGVAVAIAAGLAIALGRHQGWLYGWRLAVLFVIGALLSGYFTGYSVGLQIREEESRQTPVLLTTAVPVAGLADGVEDGGAWHYDRLYFVYRDAAAVYVSRTGSGAVACAIAEFNLRSVAMGTAR